MRIALKSIYVGTRYRKDLGGDKLNELAKDLTENGQITAITVRPIADYDKAQPDYGQEEWALVAGGRRVVAASLAGWEEIEGYAREELSELIHRILELHENIKRKEMTWQEQVDSRAEILRLRKIENPLITMGEVAKEIGDDAGNFSRDIQTSEMLKKTPSLKKAGSRSAAFKAGKLLQEHEQRDAAVLVTQASTTVEEAAGLLTERIVTRDAIEYVESLLAGSIDLALLDGPYGYNYWKQGQKAKAGREGHLSTYDDSPEAVGQLYEVLFPKLVQVVRPTGWIAMFCGMETFMLLQELSRNCCATHFKYRAPPDQNRCLAPEANVTSDCRFLTPEPYPWIWYRPNSRNQPRHPHLHARNTAELIFVCNMGRGRIVKHPCNSVLVHDAEYGASRIHVNQKPLELYKELIERFTFVGDSVLDCFFGSGNSLGAAAAISRIPYGCDSNPSMLPFALGRVRANLQLITQDHIQASLDRYKKGLEQEPQAIEDDQDQPEPEWVPSTSPGAGPFEYTRAAV